MGGIHTLLYAQLEIDLLAPLKNIKTSKHQNINISKHQNKNNRISKNKKYRNIEMRRGKEAGRHTLPLAQVEIDFLAPLMDRPTSCIFSYIFSHTWRQCTYNMYQEQ